MVLVHGKRFRYGVRFRSGLSAGFERFHDGSAWLTAFGVTIWRHRTENPSVAERGVW